MTYPPYPTFRYWLGSSWDPDGDGYGPVSMPGDVKFSIAIVDHNGWILLDGRDRSTFTAAQQDRLTLLGLTDSSIPDATNKYLSQGGAGTTPTEFSGNPSNQLTLTQDNLPSLTLNGTTNVAGSHTHTLRYPDGGSGNVTPGTQSNDAIGSIPFPGDPSIWALPAGDHSHTVSVPLGGSDIPLDIKPYTLHMNVFLYLGV